MASTELWLVRHGETEWSLSGAHTSRTDIPLTEHGRKRAEELRDYLKGMKFEAVFVSPMQRARETCAIAGYGDQAVVDDGLKEWDYGVYEGRTTAEIRAKIPGWNVWKVTIVGGESLEHVGERADGGVPRQGQAVPRSEASNARPPALQRSQSTRQGRIGLRPRRGGTARLVSMLGSPRRKVFSCQTEFYGIRTHSPVRLLGPETQG